MTLTEEEFVNELFDIAVDGKGGLSGLEANLYKSKALKLFLENQETVEKIDKYELNIFVESNGQMVTNEFRQNMAELQKILGDKE